MSSFDPLALAWRQLAHQPVKLLVALAGVMVAVLLMLMQLGFLAAAYESTLGVPRRITAELIISSPKSLTVAQPVSISRRLLYRCGAVEGVKSVQGLCLAAGNWRNPWTHAEHPIFVYGIEPGEMLIDIPGLDNPALRQPDTVVFDTASRTVFGPIKQLLADGERVEAEVNRRKIRPVATTHVGVTFGIDGNIFTTDANFNRIFQNRPPGAIELGLIRLEPGTDPVAAQARLRDLLGPDVKVRTLAEFVTAEKAFLSENAPIDFIFTMGAAVGFFIGFVTVYQILYTDVSNHLPQFATLKAVGFSQGTLKRVVVFQAVALALLGYFPAALAATGLYSVASEATQLPLRMTSTRAAGVLGATIMMCGISGLLAVRKLRAADPADVF